MSKPQTYVRTLPCHLTDDELLQRADQLSRKLAEVEQLQEQKAASASDFKARIEKADEEVSSLARMVRTKEQERPVECLSRKDFARNMVVETRADTGEVVDERAMSPEERQEAMFDETDKEVS
jgi:hypothetical protein